MFFFFFFFFGFFFALTKGESLFRQISYVQAEPALDVAAEAVVRLVSFFAIFEFDLNCFENRAFACARALFDKQTTRSNTNQYRDFSFCWFF